jgi:hypothetical protein
MTAEEKLDEILAILKRIEDCQIRTPNMVQTIGEAKPEIGSFASTDLGEKT